MFIATAPKKTVKLQRSGIALNVESMVARCRIKHTAPPGLELCSLSNPINITPRRGSIMSLPAHARNGARNSFRNNRLAISPREGRHGCSNANWPQRGASCL
jgi:hypothetical protein